MSGLQCALVRCSAGVRIRYKCISEEKFEVKLPKIQFYLNSKFPYVFGQQEIEAFVAVA